MSGPWSFFDTRPRYATAYSEVPKLSTLNPKPSDYFKTASLPGLQGLGLRV
jgi:hypothetical protein